MTREEAKKEIIDMANTLQLIPNTPTGKAVSMAINVLEQEPCEDCISREKARNCITGNELRARMVQDLDALPSVYPKQRKTSWVRGKNDSTLFFCRRCGKGVNPYWKYCPHCGAKMVEPQESEGGEE